MSAASPTRGQTWLGEATHGTLPLLSRTSGPPRGGVAPGRPRNASRSGRELDPVVRGMVAARRRAPSRSASRLATPGIPSSKTVAPSGTAPSASPSATTAVTDRRAVGDGALRLAERTTLPHCEGRRRVTRAARTRTPSRTRTPASGRRGCGDRRGDDEQSEHTEPADPDRAGRRSCWLAVGHASKSTERGVASTYRVFDMPTISSRCPPLRCRRRARPAHRPDAPSAQMPGSAWVMGKSK